MDCLFVEEKMKTIVCAECNINYVYEPNPNYPDKRKYCANCSEKKKASWDSKPEDISTKNIPRIGTMEDFPVESKDSLEYEIRDREVRARALESAIKWFISSEKTSTSDLLTIAKIFEVYIRG